MSDTGDTVPAEAVGGSSPPALPEVPPWKDSPDSPTTGDTDVECDICGRRFKNNNGLGVHKATIHRKDGKKITRKRSAKPPTLRALVTQPPHDDPLHADDIFMATVHSLFPNGEIPLTALLPLMRWREATDELLREIDRG